MTSAFKKVASPVGELTLLADAGALVTVLWENDDPGRVPLRSAEEANDHPVLMQTAEQLEEYFARKRKCFSLPLTFHGTPFQRRVWQGLLAISYGTTQTYRQIAEGIGQPKAARAVGAANGKNPLSIIAACHRVVGSNGSLIGFAGGLAAKAHLLNLERDGQSPNLFATGL